MKNSEVLSIRVTGKVQGVFFRKSTEEKAGELGVKGLVRNEDDGSVYIEAQGGDTEKFIDWLHKGPPRAEVDQVKVEKMQADLYFEDFRVKRSYNS